MTSFLMQALLVRIEKEAQDKKKIIIYYNVHRVKKRNHCSTRMCVKKWESDERIEGISSFFSSIADARGFIHYIGKKRR